MTYYSSSPVLGALDITTLTSTAPGVAVLPGTPLQPALGEIRVATDGTYGMAEFIYLKIPTSTTLAAGNLVQWTAGYAAAILPVLATSKNTGHQVAVAPVAVASSTTVQYGWFQISGQCLVLKTAVAMSPDAVVYASATTGRIKALTSAGGQITGLRVASVASVTSTTSTVLCYLNRPAMQGQIT